MRDWLSLREIHSKKLIRGFYSLLSDPWSVITHCHLSHANLLQQNMQENRTTSNSEKKNSSRLHYPEFSLSASRRTFAGWSLWTWERLWVAAGFAGVKKKKKKKLFDREVRRPVQRRLEKGREVLSVCQWQFPSQRGGRTESDKWFVRVQATGHGAKCQGLSQPWAEGSATSTPQRGKYSGGWECEWCEDTEIKQNGNDVASLRHFI